MSEINKEATLLEYELINRLFMDKVKDKFPKRSGRKYVKPYFGKKSVTREGVELKCVVE